MNSTDIQNKVYKLVSEIMETALDEVNEASSSDTIESWDSMTQMSLTLAIQEEFQIKFQGSQGTKLKSVKLILAAVDELLKAK